VQRPKPLRIGMGNRPGVATPIQTAARTSRPRARSKSSVAARPGRWREPGSVLRQTDHTAGASRRGHRGEGEATSRSGQQRSTSQTGLPPPIALGWPVQRQRHRPGRPRLPVARNRCFSARFLRSRKNPRRLAPSTRGPARLAWPKRAASTIGLGRGGARRTPRPPASGRPIRRPRRGPSEGPRTRARGRGQSSRAARRGAEHAEHRVRRSGRSLPGAGEVPSAAAAVSVRRWSDHDDAGPHRLAAADPRHRTGWHAVGVGASSSGSLSVDVGHQEREVLGASRLTVDGERARHAAAEFGRRCWCPEAFASCFDRCVLGQQLAPRCRGDLVGRNRLQAPREQLRRRAPVTGRQVLVREARSSGSVGAGRASGRRFGRCIGLTQVARG